MLHSRKKLAAWLWPEPPQRLIRVRYGALLYSNKPVSHYADAQILGVHDRGIGMYVIADYEFDHTASTLEGPLALLAGVIEFIFY